MAPGVLQQNACGGRFASDHVQKVQVDLCWVETMEVGHRVLSLLLVPLPGDDPIARLDVPKRIVVWTDVVWEVEHLLNNSTVLRQRHEAVPEGHHVDNRGVDVLDQEQVP